MDTRTRDKNLRPESDTTRDKEETAIRRHIFRNRLISIVRPHSESRSVPMNRLAENMSWSGGTQLIRSSSSNSSRLWLTYHVIFIVSPSFSPPPTFPHPSSFPVPPLPLSKVKFPPSEFCHSARLVGWLHHVSPSNVWNLYRHRRRQ